VAAQPSLAGRGCVSEGNARPTNAQGPWKMHRTSGRSLGAGLCGLGRVVENCLPSWDASHVAVFQVSTANHKAGPEAHCCGARHQHRRASTKICTSRRRPLTALLRVAQQQHLAHLAHPAPAATLCLGSSRVAVNGNLVRVHIQQHGHKMKQANRLGAQTA
jgi:hypothetical protein